MREVTCTKCYGRGWSPVWVEDPTDDWVGGYEDGERYCDCPSGVRLRERESAPTTEKER